MGTPTLERDAHGRLLLTLADGTRHEDVHPVRAFPLSDAAGALSLVGPDGHERLWIDDPAALPPPMRALLDAELAARSFMPSIEAIVAVSTFTTPSDWTVDTDRGRHTLVLGGEEDIRRLPDGRLLVTDRHGIAYVIATPAALDRRSRRLLERFL
ncbi:cyanophycin metabolism-associated DUF1854 family protein [Rubrivivax albus]|uniref:DUF1854 domain-containing protein n=1 Tax=Rubrivivax albus TaxID=2499835 RepID=A0A437JR53_9BURK|nr:DUF1854 domain-containing protein [Rubrivivax albus]RVT49359.1 DUF1854 domain-containing protein [Rubrivivax albus]